MSIGRSVQSEHVGSSGHEMVPAYQVWSDQTDDEAGGSSPRGSHSDSFHDTIRCRGASCSTNHFQTPCGSESSVSHVRVPRHRRLRLQWCHARATWNATDWQNVVFSDESRFVLGTDDNRVRVWRRPGGRYNCTQIVARHTARTAGVMVWGGHNLFKPVHSNCGTSNLNGPALCL
ncbi:hypothetical protein AVEN_47609-1 [Araneus ventricosus]|uniref:Uncharacterized protein n=1 Tax=Araneus ventricosus TaxID=182803 RepID=A0A4Y2VC52_ARAVE|nr:hypothetical protein AVEN_47609-1 [Araneus ventricosus]